MPYFKMTDMTEKYTTEEILEIFKEQHRLCSPLDPEADSWAEISPEMSIREWRWANDLLEWKALSKFLNQEFRINLPENTWYETLEPAKRRRLIEVCELISKHATKEYFQERKFFGQPCLKASLFLTIKRNLEKKGVNVSDLRPSSSFNEYLDNYFSPIIEEITLTGTKPIDKIETIRRKKGFWNAINIFDPERHEILTGDLKTFRDLVDKIIDEREKNKA
jgi:hypothetical protein